MSRLHKLVEFAGRTNLRRSFTAAGFLVASSAVVSYVLLDVVLPRLPNIGPLRSLVNDARSSGTRLELAFWGSVMVAGIALLIGKRSRTWLLAAIVLASTSSIALYEATLNPHALVAPSVAVGAAAFFGFSPSTNLDAVYAMYALTASVAVILVVAGRLLPRRRTGLVRISGSSKLASTTDVSPTVSNHFPRRAAWFVIVFSVLLVLAACLPDLHALVAATRTQQYVSEWDSDNDLTWLYFAARGLVPMKDFWFPYGNSLVFQSSLLGGSMLYFGYQAVTILGYTWVFWRLSGRRAVVTCLAELGLVLALPLINADEVWDQVGVFWRYGFAFMIGLVFCIVRTTEAPRARLWARLAFSLIVAIAAFSELDLLAYAAISCLMVFLIECAARIWQMKSEHSVVAKWSDWIAGLSGDLLGPAIAVAAFVIVSALRGQLGNMIAFYAHPGAFDAYTDVNVPLFSGFASLFSLDVVFLWLPAVVFGGAIVIRWGVARSQNNLLVAMLASVSGAGALFLTKDVVRPITTDLTLVLVLVALLCIVAAANQLLLHGRHAAPVALGLIVGLLAAAIVGSGEVPTLTSGVGAAPARLYHDLVTVIRPTRADITVERERFAPFHFSQYSSELDLANAIKPLIGRSTSNVYVLGDAEIEYILLNQRPPWEINLFNASPIGDQRHVVAWLHDYRPAVVIDAPNLVTDGVPMPVRVPLIYQQIVATYEPERVVAGYEVLRRMRVGERPAAQFWLKTLGDVLDLGAIPDSESPIPRVEAGNVQTPVLHMRTKRGITAGLVGVPLVFGKSVVTVEFQLTPGRTTYEIPVDRLWPWGLSHQVKIVGAASRGSFATLSSGSMPSSRLY